MMALRSNKKIFFVISYQYLSIPIFNSIAKILDDSENYLIYFEELFIEQDTNKIESEKTSSLWRDVILLKPLESQLAKEIIRKKSISTKTVVFIKNLILYKNKINNILNELNPNLIITTTDSTFVSRVIIEYSERNKIPIILFQPSFINTFPENTIRQLKTKMKYFLFNKIFKIPIFNKQPFWGNESDYTYKFLWSDKFSTFINNKSLIRIVGNPLVEKYITLKDDTGEKTRNQFKIPVDKPIITICTEGYKGSIDETLVNSIYKGAITFYKNLYFIIKVHPRDDETEYKQYFMKEGIENLIVVKDFPLLEIYKITDLQISINSYASFEALLCNIPVILVKRELIDLPDYFNVEVVLYANSTEELKICIEKALTENYKECFQKKRKIFLQSIYGSTNPLEVKKNIKERIHSIL